MSLAIDLFTVIAVAAGVFFFLAGTVALLRFPDSMTRLHALTKADNLGLGFVVLGLLPRAGTPLAALKLVVLWTLVQLSSGSVAQLIGALLRRRDTRQ
jgi:multicomponent Na+:H+ antiporter subunit G